MPIVIAACVSSTLRNDPIDEGISKESSCDSEIEVVMASHSDGNVESVTYCIISLMELIVHPYKYVGEHVTVIAYYDIEQFKDIVGFRRDSIQGPIIAAESLLIEKWESIDYVSPGYYRLFGRVVESPSHFGRQRQLILETTKGEFWKPVHSELEESLWRDHTR